MSLNTYYNPVKTIFGENALQELAGFVNRLSRNDRVLIVTDEGLLKILNILPVIENLFEKHGFSYEIYQKPPGFSSIEVIDAGLGAVRSFRPGIIIGIGGGSALDTAKCVSCLVNDPMSRSVGEFVKHGIPLPPRSLPLIQVPTTAGTGSEVTKWATVWDLSEVKKKYSLSGDPLYADVALIDPALTANLPPQMTATTGFDALSQAIEAYWSRNHNMISDLYAAKAIPLILQWLPVAFSEPTNLEARSHIAAASLLSGLAFSNTKTTAVHSVSYPMTLFYNIPHGHACALTLGEFLKFNAMDCPENTPEGSKRVKYLCTLLGVKTAEEGALALLNLMKSVELESRLSALGLTRADLDTIVRDGFTPDRVAHNPRVLTEPQLRQILESIF